MGGRHARRFYEIPTTFPESTEFRYVVDDWAVTYHLGRTAEGGLVIRHLAIDPVMRAAKDVFAPVPDGGITTRLLRRLRLAPELRYARALIETQAIPETIPKRTRTGERAAAGRPTLPLSFYLRVRVRWRELMKARDQHYARTLAREFGYERSAMRSVLLRCRKMGLLRM